MQPKQQGEAQSPWTDNDWPVEDDALLDEVWDQLAQEQTTDESTG